MTWTKDHDHGPTSTKVDAFTIAPILSNIINEDRGAKRQVKWIRVDRIQRGGYANKSRVCA